VKSSSPAPPPEAERPPGALAQAAPETAAVVSNTVPSRRVAAWADRFAPALTFIGLVIVWEAAARFFEIPSFLLPAPSAIIEAGLAVPVTVWLGHIWATLRVALMGFALATVVSIPLAVALTYSRLLSRTLYPILIIIQSTPIVAIAPIIVVTLGASDLPRVVITFLITFFPIVVTTATGLLATPDELIELSRSLRAPRIREIIHIRLPYAVPYIFSALKIATTLAVIGAVVAEFVAAERGLGFFILFSTSYFKIPQAFAGLAVLVTLSLVLFRLVGLAQRWFAPWSLPKSQR
jgi:NitT/TauT family transport system permease protein